MQPRTSTAIKRLDSNKRGELLKVAGDLISEGESALRSDQFHPDKGPSIFAAAVRLKLHPVLGQGHQVTRFILGPIVGTPYRANAANMRQALDHLHTVCEVIESGGGGPNLPSWIVGHRAPDFVLVVLGTVIAIPVGTYLRQGMTAFGRIWQWRR